MPETFFTSDHHFGHRGIISMCGRPFADVAEMDEAMIARWNERVRGNDVVYHLGDFTMGASAERGAEIFKRLKGRKHLIVGNHDALKVRSLPWASEPRDRVMLRHPGEKLPIVLEHYSMRVWPSAHHGAIHLYGHSHGNLPGVGHSLDVGVDCWDFRPVTLDELRPTLERQHEEFERQREAARMFRERAARGDPAAALEILRRVPDVVPEAGDEPWNEMPTDLRNGDYDQALEVGLRTALFERPADPLGYDTTDPGYLRQMAGDALAGRNEDAVDAELARVRQLLVPGLSGPGSIDEQAETVAKLWTENREAKAVGIGYASRVVQDPEIMSGEPCVEGTRVPARTVLAYLKAGHSDVEIFTDYPSLPVDGIDAVRRWASELGFGMPGDE